MSFITVYPPPPPQPHTLSHTILQLSVFADGRILFESGQPLAYAESPHLENSTSARCLHFEMIRMNNRNRFRVSQNSSGELTTLEYLNDVIVQDVSVPVQVSLPPGSYGILFESQSDLEMHSASSLAIDNIIIRPGACPDGKNYIFS